MELGTVSRRGAWKPDHRCRGRRTHGGIPPRRSDQYSFNFGIGGILDLDTRILGDGIIANEPLPRGKPAPYQKQPPAQGSSCSFRSDGICQPLASPHSLSCVSRRFSTLVCGDSGLTSFIESG